MNRLESLGFTRWEANQLRRIEMTLHRWSEHECNGNIQREGENSDGKPRWHNLNHSFVDPHDPRASHRIPDRERGALKRLGKIVGDCNTRNWIGFNGPIAENPKYLVSYHQTDPRGCALYVGLKSDLRNDPIDSCYSRLVAVCE